MYDPNDPNAYLRKILADAEREAAKQGMLADFALIFLALVFLAAIPIVILFA